ncbi:hypothetical protein [Dinoroseobacter sp. S124A]|uniref:hypothetical protein n=1 Tax=Dinoroseobacter sp. S124A TaxID=3415128 RepID=UPI003C7DB886
MGGLAAIAHGGTRPLHDIDLYMPFDHPRWPGFLAAIRPHVTWGPEKVVEGPWDLSYLKLLHGRQKIEIGAAERTRILDHATGTWVRQVIAFDRSVIRCVLGCEVAVMPAAQLIAYKRLLGRDVDLEDIRALGAA